MRALRSSATLVCAPPVKGSDSVFLRPLPMPEAAFRNVSVQEWCPSSAGFLTSGEPFLSSDLVSSGFAIQMLCNLQVGFTIYQWTVVIAFIRCTEGLDTRAVCNLKDKG